MRLVDVCTVRSWYAIVVVSLIVGFQCISFYICWSALTKGSAAWMVRKLNNRIIDGDLAFSGCDLYESKQVDSPFLSV